MWRPRVDAGWSFIVAAALAASVAGHHVIETIGERGGPIATTYGAYRHVAVGPVTVLALVMAVWAVCALLRDRRRSYAFGRSDVLAREATAIVAMEPRVLFGIIAALQLGLLFAMESVEHVVAFGTPTQGLDWLGGDAPVALAVQFVLASVAALVLARAGRDLLKTCDRVLALVDALVAFLRPLLARDARLRPLLRRRRRVAATPRAARCIGLRAPPVPS
jgi:hypothetical protein